MNKKMSNKKEESMLFGDLDYWPVIELHYLPQSDDGLGQTFV